VSIFDSWRAPQKPADPLSAAAPASDLVQIE
jgi:hypothetical protein